MGDSYVSDWAKSVSAKGAVTLLEDCRVTIDKPNGTCSRFREAPKAKGDKERNGYDLNGARFEAIGVSVPEQVSEFFNWSEVNIQKQQDPAFLLSKGAGEVATFLNKTVRLDSIDTHIQAASALLRGDKAALALLQSKQADDEKALEALAWVPAIQGRLESLDALVQAHEALKTRVQKLQGIRSQIEELEARIQGSETIVSMEPRAKELRRLNDWRRGLMDQRRKLMEASEQWAKWEGVLTASEGVVKLGSRVQGLRDLVEKRQGHIDIGHVLHEFTGRWMSLETTEATVRSTLLLEPRVRALRADWEKAKALRLQGTLLRDLVERWSEIRVSSVDWEPLERGAKILRARMSRAQALREQVEGVRKFRLTITGLETTIQEAGKLVSELEALRPATCPLCGGPMHKGEHS
jgi:DNA repair exonuclease SbcCD ATPase subunit